MAVVGLTAQNQSDVDGEVFWEAVTTIFWPMLVGSIPIGIIVWLAFYLPLKRAVDSYQHGRARRLQRRREKSGPRRIDVPHNGANPNDGQGA